MEARRSQTFEVTRAIRAEASVLAAIRSHEDDRWRRARSIGILGTVALHLLVFLFFQNSPVVIPTPFAAAGPAAGDYRPAGGGSGLTMIDIRPVAPPTAQEETPVPVPVIDPVEVVVPPEEVVEETTPAPELPSVLPPAMPGVGGAGTGGQGGQATGPGTSNGDGAGGGGNSDGGASQIIPPTPRGIFIPPSGRPASARNQEITVWVFVSESGRVDRNTVRLEPPTSDSRYNQRLIQSVAEWVFDPARQNGRPVPVWYPFQIIL